MIVGQITSECGAFGVDQVIGIVKTGRVAVDGRVHPRWIRSDVLPKIMRELPVIVVVVQIPNQAELPVVIDAIDLLGLGFRGRQGWQQHAGQDRDDRDDDQKLDQRKTGRERSAGSRKPEFHNAGPANYESREIRTPAFFVVVWLHTPQSLVEDSLGTG